MLALRKRSLQPGDVGLEEVPEPRPGAGQVLVEVWGAGVCGTDLHIAEGSFTSYPPVTMGHEITGVVAAAGDGVDTDWAGRHVVCETFFSTCGICEWCRDGRPNLCLERRSLGSGADGGFARWVVVPARNLHRLPEGIDPRAAALAEPLACVCQSLCDPSRVEPGDDVLVLGPGTMGLLSAQVARACGGRPLVVGTPQDEVRLDAARALGFETAMAGDQGPVQALGGGHGPHVVIECSGNARAMAAGIEATRRGGTYVQIGQTDQAVPVRLALASFHELRISGGFASTPHSWRRAIELLASGAVRLEPIVSAYPGLREWETAFSDTAAGRGVKFVFDPRAGA